MTMKLRRRSAFFICTKAPATGAPDASRRTPVRVPTASCADAAFRQGAVATNANAAVNGFSMLNLPRCPIFAEVGVGGCRNVSRTQDGGQRPGQGQGADGKEARQGRGRVS